VIIVAVFFGLNFKILNLDLPIFVPRISPNGAINPPSNIKKIIKIKNFSLLNFSYYCDLLMFLLELDDNVKFL